MARPPISSKHWTALNQPGEPAPTLPTRYMFYEDFINLFGQEFGIDLTNDDGSTNYQLTFDGHQVTSILNSEHSCIMPEDVPALKNEDAARDDVTVAFNTSRLKEVLASYAGERLVELSKLSLAPDYNALSDYAEEIFNIVHDYMEAGYISPHEVDLSLEDVHQMLDNTWSQAAELYRTRRVSTRTPNEVGR